MKKRKKVKWIIVISVVLLLVAWGAYDIYMDREQRYDYEDIPGGIQMIFDASTGTYIAELDFAQQMGVNFDAQIERSDPVSGDQYYRVYYYFTARPIDFWNGYCHKKLQTMIDYYPDGRKRGLSAEGINIYDVELYYVNKDGSVVLFWHAENQFPDVGEAE